MLFKLETLKRTIAVVICHATWIGWVLIFGLPLRVFLALFLFLLLFSFHLLFLFLRSPRHLWSVRPSCRRRRREVGAQRRGMESSRRKG